MFLPKRAFFFSIYWFSCLLALGQRPQNTGSFELPTRSVRNETLLNGLWSFTSNADHKQVSIRVPGAYCNVMDGKWGKPYWDAFNYPKKWIDKGAVYEKEIEVTPSMIGKHLRLVVGGCWQNYSVIFENKTFDTVHDGYSTRCFDLGSFPNPGRHLLKIRVEDEGTRLSGGESMKSRGIWDDISLLTLSEVCVDHGLAVRTFVGKKSLAVSVPLRNLSEKNQSFTVKYFVTDAEGKIVKSFDGGQRSLAPMATDTLVSSAPWETPRLWWPHDPYLYHLNTVIYNQKGKAIDRHEQRFGFREIGWGNAKITLNGRELLLRGHGEHYLGDIQASREYFTAWLTELKKMGVNFMRLHIYPRHKVLYEVADELGFFLEAEPAFHFLVPGTPEFAKKHLGDMMIDLINHPSIFVWSISNELRWRGGGEKPWLIDHARQIDKTRPAFASDFSAFSTHGDLIGHHYNTDSVFKEWEDNGPDKAMVWDECGEVWQPNRPLGNGTAGYEAIAQDYATGIYRDGQNEIKAAFDLVREGKVFNGSLHRVNAISPWDFGCVFFRWQPYNRYNGIAPVYKTLEGPDVKPAQVLPCTTPVNIWDSTLPIYEPNPGYYLFAEDMKWVRFPYDSKHFSFFGGEKTTVRTPLLQYDDLRLVDEVHCKIETPDGKVLSETVKPLGLKPGDMLRDIDWEFNFPSVKTAAPIRIVREFWHQGSAGYRDVREGRIFPRLSASLLHLNGKKIGIIDEEGGLANMLSIHGIPFTKVSGAVNPIEVNILLVNGSLPTSSYNNFISKGGTVIVFEKNSDSLQPGSARLLVNGSNYKILNGIGQEQLTFWKGGSEYGGKDASLNIANNRTLIAGDKDGKTYSLKETYIGKGCFWNTTLKIIPSIDTEPAAGWLLHNLIEAAARYHAPIDGRAVAVFGEKDFQDWSLCGNTSNMKFLASLLELDLKKYQVLFLDARKHGLTETEIKKVRSFEMAGGKVCVYQITDKTIDSYKKLISDSLTLTQPFLNEKAGCVKAATSWTLRNSPGTGVEYYDSVVIPQPFEPNYSPLLAGLSNITLNWNGKSMFGNGVKLNGISPVSVTDRFSVLVSNWRNDWSVPPFGAEYINEGKDMRQAMWYLNRDPVLASIKNGKGEYLLCQLDLMNGGTKAQTLMNQILTNWECAFRNDCSFPDKKDVFDFTANEDQRQRMATVERQLARLKPLDSLPSVFYNMGGSSDGKQRKILLLTDGRLLAVAPEIIKKMNGFGNLSYSGVSVNNPQAFNTNVESALGGTKWDVIYLTIGYEGISDFSETGLQAFDASINTLVTTLKNTGAKLMWGSQPPLPKAWETPQLDNEKINLLNQRTKKIMEANSVLANDTYGYIVDKTPEYLAQDKKELTLINSDFHKSFTPKLVATIVEALKFFGN